MTLFDDDEAAAAHERITADLDDSEPEPRGPVEPTPAELAEARRRLFSNRREDPPGPSGEAIAEAARRLLGSDQAAGITPKKGDDK